MVLIDEKGSDLLVKYDDAKRMLKEAKTSEERLAISNYLGNIYSALLCMGKTDLDFERNKIFGGKKEYNKFVKKINIYDDRLVHNFILHKDFHHDYMGEILPTVEDELINVFECTFDEDKLTKEEIIEIVFEFMKGLGLETLFDEFYKNGRIHSTLVGQEEGNLGFTLYNPLNKDTDIFVREFDEDFTSLHTLVHELGHGYDLKRFDGSIDDYNDYFYLSFYGETISRLFERLLFRYLIKNDIKADMARDKLIDTEDLNHDFLLQTYLLSVLEDDYLLSGEYLEFKKEKIIKKVRRHFMDEECVREFLDRITDLDISDACNYAYGDILSMFLCEEVEANGFNSDLLDYFLSHRKDKFDPELFRELGFGPENYKFLYKKETQLIKK